MDYVYFALLVGVVALSFAAGKLIGPLLLWFARLFVSKTKTTLDDRIFAEIRGPVESFFFLFIFYLSVRQIAGLAGAVLITASYTVAAMLLLLTFLAYRVVKAVFHWYYEEGYKASRIKIDLALMPLFMKISQLAIIVVGAIMVLNEIGVNITAILAFTSIVGLVAGLASQETLANVFAGIALQLDGAYHYGDYLRLPSGEVVRLKKIGMRSTKLVDLFGKFVILSNSEFAKLRLTKMGKAGAKADLAVAFEAPVGLSAEQVVKAVESGLQKKPLEGVDASSVKCVKTMLKIPGFYEGRIIVTLSDLAYSPAASDRILSILSELVKKTKN